MHDWLTLNYKHHPLSRLIKVALDIPPLHLLEYNMLRTPLRYLRRLWTITYPDKDSAERAGTTGYPGEQRLWEWYMALPLSEHHGLREVQPRQFKITSAGDTAYWAV